MTPFQVFRLWLRRGPLVQKAASAGAAGLVLAALIWTVIPANSQSATGLRAGGGPGSNGAGGTQSTATTTTGASAAGSGSGSVVGNATTAGATPSGGGTSAGGQCVSPPGSAAGVTANSINIAVLITDIAGPAADGTFGIAPPKDQQAAFQAVINNINGTGGVACRKLVPQFYTANPVDQQQLQQLCSTMVQSGTYAVIDTGVYANYPVGLDCIGQNHLAYFGGYMFSAAQLKQFYPYLFDLNELDIVYHNSVFALKQLGFFSPANGFTKLGLIYRDCYPELFNLEMGWLAQAGVPASQVDAYDMSCPSAFASPTDIENAISEFQRDNVHNVTEVDELGDFATFTNVAQQQGFRPKYGVGDDALLEIASGSQAPNPQNIDGAIAITGSRDGENNTPGLGPTAGTKRCDAVMQGVGLAPVYNQPAAIGNACDQLWMFQTALDNAPNVASAALVYGLQRAGSIDWSYPQGPNSFTASGTTTGGQFWRVAQFYASCTANGCWKVTDPNFHLSFP